MNKQVICIDFFKKDVKNIIWEKEKFNSIFLFGNYLWIGDKKVIKMKGENSKFNYILNYKDILEKLNLLEWLKIDIVNGIKEIKINEKFFGILDKKNELYIYNIKFIIKNSNLKSENNKNLIIIKNVKYFDFGINHISGILIDNKVFFLGKNYLGECGNSLINILKEPLIIDLKKKFNNVKCGKKCTIFYNLNGTLKIFGKFNNIITKRKNPLNINLNLDKIKITKIDFYNSIIFYIQKNNLIAIDSLKTQLINKKDVKYFEILKDKLLVYFENQIKFYELFSNKSKILLKKGFIKIKYNDIKIFNITPNSDYKCLILKRNKEFKNIEFHKKINTNNSVKDLLKNKSEVNNIGFDKQQKIIEIKNLINSKVHLDNNSTNKLNNIKNKLDHLITINKNKKEEKSKKIIENDVNYLKENEIILKNNDYLLKLIIKITKKHELNLKEIFLNNLKNYFFNNILKENKKLKMIEFKYKTFVLNKLNKNLSKLFNKNFLIFFNILIKKNNIQKSLEKLNKIYKNKILLNLWEKIKIAKITKIENNTNINNNNYRNYNKVNKIMNKYPIKEKNKPINKKLINKDETNFNKKKINYLDDSNNSISEIMKVNQSYEHNKNFKDKLSNFDKKNKNFLSNNFLLKNKNYRNRRKNLIP